MSQYMGRDDWMTDWHQTQDAVLARSGAGLLVVETHAVSAQGRRTIRDIGL